MLRLKILMEIKWIYLLTCKNDLSYNEDRLILSKGKE